MDFIHALFIEIIAETIKISLSSTISVYAVKLYIDSRKKAKEKSHSLDWVVTIHHQLNELILAILAEVHADRVMLFQTENGRYFIGGTPLMKMIPTNEKTANNLERFKDTHEEVNVSDWEEQLYKLKMLGGLMTLSADNQYESLIDSRIALRKRGVNSGIYIAFEKTIFGIKKTVGILCIEYRHENPALEQEAILSICADQIQKIRKLIVQKVDIKLEI